MKSAQEIVQLMMDKDAFSQWLGVEILEVKEGYCKLSCIVRDEMLNGFHIAHGGITYSLSDSALAFASNTKGQQCVSIETSISHLRPVNAGDKLDVVCEEMHRSRSYAVYTAMIHNQKEELVSTFKGTVKVSSREW